MHKKLYSPGCLTLHSLKMDNALKRTLMFSVVWTSMLISTEIVALVLPGLLCGSPVKFRLKINTSEKNPSASCICKMLSQVIPAGGALKAEFISDPVHHFLPVEFLRLRVARARVDLSAAGANGNLCLRPKVPRMNLFKVTRQRAVPR